MAEGAFVKLFPRIGKFRIAYWGEFLAESSRVGLRFSCLGGGGSYRKPQRATVERGELAVGVFVSLVCGRAWRRWIIRLNGGMC